MPQVLVLLLQSFPLGRVPPHAFLHALVVLLDQVHLLLQFTELKFQCLDVMLPLLQFLGNVLVPPSQLLDLVGRAHVQFGHSLLEELNLIVLLLKLVFQQTLFVLVETNRRTRHVVP